MMEQSPEILGSQVELQEGIHIAQCDGSNTLRNVQIWLKSLEQPA